MGSKKFQIHTVVWSHWFFFLSVLDCKGASKAYRLHKEVGTETRVLLLSHFNLFRRKFGSGYEEEQGSQGSYHVAKGLELFFNRWNLERVWMCYAGEVSCWVQWLRKETFSSSDSHEHSELSICQVEWLQPPSPASNQHAQIKHDSFASECGQRPSTGTSTWEGERVGQGISTGELIPIKWGTWTSC